MTSLAFFSPALITAIPRSSTIRRPQMCSSSLPSTTRRAVVTFLLASMIPRISRAEDLSGLQQLALSYTRSQRFEDADALWSRAIALDPKNAAAFSNRGNGRIALRRFEDALADFDTAIDLAPQEPDPFLGRGVALEALRRYREAVTSYENANSMAMKRGGEDSGVLNNLGNAWGALGEWTLARDFYKRAAELDPRFVFALANEALASLEIGDNDSGSRIIRFLLRKYPSFADMHAANAMILWEQGETSLAETEWFKATQQDNRYEDINWVTEVRRWPPRLIQTLRKFRQLEKS